jgi:hypothetical protein
MTPTTARRMHWTEEDYLRMEAQSPIKHEFLDGEVFAMAGAWTSALLREGDVTLSGLGGAISFGDVYLPPEA